MQLWKGHLLYKTIYNKVDGIYEAENTQFHKQIVT